MDVRLPDGTVISNVPDGITKAQLTEKLAASGYDISSLQPTETRANVQAEKPKWAKEYPRLYETAVKARELAGPTVEMLGTLGGGALGAGAGLVAGPVGAATGAVGGAGLGYGISKEALEAADVALGLKAPRTVNQLVTEPVRNVLTGATLEAGGRVAGPIIEKGLSALGRGATGVVGAIQDARQMPRQLAGKIARETFETPANLKVGRNALRQAIEAGETLTPAQALAQGKVISPTTQAMLEDVTKQIAPAAKVSKAAAQEAARQTTLKAITPDITEAVKLRAQAADPLYKAADEAVTTVDDTLKSIIDRMPKGTLDSAAEIAKIEGKPFPASLDVGNSLTGQQMHYIKRALSDKAYGPEAATGLGQDAQRAVKTLLDDYLGAFESRVPEYGQARQLYSEMSAPINQAQVLKEMVSVLQKPGGGERVGPFLNVLGRGEEAMLKRAGGRGAARYEALEEVLTPEQIAVVRNVAKELEANQAVRQQITVGQQRFSDLMKDYLPSFRLPNIFNIFATTANKILEVVGAKAGKKTMAELEKAATSAQSFDDLLAALPATERNRVLKVIRDPETWAPLSKKVGKVLPESARGGVAAGATNALAPEEQNQNALAR